MFQGDSEKPGQVMKVQFSGFYANSIINLSDGVAFRSSGISGQGKVSTFYYHVINLESTFVMLKNIRGDFKFYVKVIKSSERNQASVSEADYDFASESSNFFQNPSLTITKDDYFRNPCSECSLLIAVYTVDDIGG